MHTCRAVVVVGDEQGQVGVGCASAKEVVQAVAKAVVGAKNELVRVPLTNSATFPHRIDGYFGAAKVMLRPASEGTGVIAGGAVRVVLELAGVKNAFGKQLGSPNPLNNARAALVGLSEMRTFKEVAAQRDMTIEEFMGRIKGRQDQQYFLHACNQLTLAPNTGQKNFVLVCKFWLRFKVQYIQMPT